jgi:hypothetical protein
VPANRSSERYAQVKTGYNDYENSQILNEEEVYDESFSQEMDSSSKMGRLDENSPPPKDLTSKNNLMKMFESDNFTMSQ